MTLSEPSKNVVFMATIVDIVKSYSKIITVCTSRKIVTQLNIVYTRWIMRKNDHTFTKRS